MVLIIINYYQKEDILFNTNSKMMNTYWPIIACHYRRLFLHNIHSISDVQWMYLITTRISEISMGLSSIIVWFEVVFLKLFADFLDLSFQYYEPIFILSEYNSFIKYFYYFRILRLECVLNQPCFKSIIIHRPGVC